MRRSLAIASIPNTSTLRTTILLALTVACVATVSGQRRDESSPKDQVKEHVAGEPCLEQAFRDLTSLNDKLREARQQQTDERVSAARILAALQAENKELKRTRTQNEHRIAALNSSMREAGGLKRTPSPEDMTQKLQTLVQTVGELQGTLDRTGPSRPGDNPATNGKPQETTHDKDGRGKP
jgi:hypothetical protein